MSAAEVGNPSVYELEIRELRQDRDRLRVELASARKDVARLLSERKKLSAGLRRLWGEARGEHPITIVPDAGAPT